MKFTSVTIEWSPNTFIFYLAIIIGCYLIACIIKKKNIKWGKSKKKQYPAALLLVSILLLYVKCFNTTGRDLRAGYYYNFLSATSMSAFRDQTVEPGYRLLNVIVRTFTNNYSVFLFVIGVLMIVPVIHFIHKYYDKIDVPAAILLFTSLYFFNSFSAFRQYMAVSISLYAFDAIIEKKQYKALFWIIVSSTIHVSCLALVIPYILCFAKMFSRKTIAISALVFFAALYVGRDSITSLLGGTERYSIYFASQQVKFGFEQIVYYVPMFLLLYICRKYTKEINISRQSYIYIITGFVFGMFSYVLPIFGRMQALFIPIIIIVPYYLKLYKDHHKQKKRIIANSLTLFYCIARFVIWITQYYNMEDLMPYTNMFGIII